MHSAKDELLKVLKEARELLVLPDNDFIWSRWNDAVEALTEFDALVSGLVAGHCDDLSRLSILFAPTGAVQEVSLNSGWGREFCDMTARFDFALADYQRETRI